jgi:hypothetical protein
LLIPLRAYYTLALALTQGADVTRPLLSARRQPRALAGALVRSFIYAHAGSEHQYRHNCRADQTGAGRSFKSPGSSISINRSMRTVLLVLGLAAACLAAEIPKNATEASAVSTPALVVPAAAPAPVGAAIGAVVNATKTDSHSGNVQLRPEDLLHPEMNFNPVPSTEKSTVSVDNLFPDIHHVPFEGGISAKPAPAYVVNETQYGGENIMEVTTKHTFIMKISSTTGKPGAHPEPHPEPEPTAEPEPSSGSTAGGHGSTAGGHGSSTKQTTLKPSSLPKTSGASSLSPALVVAAAAVLFSRLC